MALVAGTGGINRRNVFLSLLPPLSGDRRLAISLVGLSILILAILAPYADVPLKPVPPFQAAHLCALLVCSVVTAAVLYGQYSIQHTRALLILTVAYLFIGLTSLPNPMSISGMFLSGVFGMSRQTGAWLYLLRETGFAGFVLAYAFAKHDNTELAQPYGAFLTWVGVTIVVVFGLAFLTSGGWSLPALITPEGIKTPLMNTAMVGICGFNCLVLLALWRRRPHATLDLWMMVVMATGICEICVGTTLNSGGFDVGFYAGRVFGLVAASFVLIMLLLETRGLYTRLARHLDNERSAAETRADTAQRLLLESAETLRAVVDASSLAVVALSPNAKVLIWNKTAQRLFGYSSEEVIGQPYPLLPDDLGARTDQEDLLRQSLAGARIHDAVFRCRRKDGSEPDVRGSAVPFYDATKNLRGIALALEDVTEKNATEGMLRQAQKMEAVGQLTGGVAHDFNNILMVILSNVEELQEGDNLTDEQQEMLASIATSGGRAAELTKRLLAFSRKQRLVPQPTDITDLVASIDKLLRRSLGEQIEIEAIFADDIWITSIDRSQLEAALVNLCVNARDAMPNGGRLLIETANKPLDHQYATDNPGVVPGDYVMLAVSDTGSGIPPDVLAKVFEPFFTTKDVGKGTGLGLSMVYGFIKQSSGHIKIYSEVGKGTTIRMYLPRVDVEADEGEVIASVQPRGNERILLVEDDEQVRSTVVTQLKSLGYEVMTAANGGDALDHLNDGERFELLLTDVIMPGLDGPALVRLMKERWPQVKVLFMSGYSENAAVHHGHIDASAPILSKPFRKIDLALRVRDVLESRQQGA